MFFGEYTDCSQLRHRAAAIRRAATWAVIAGCAMISEVGQPAIASGTAAMLQQELATYYPSLAAHGSLSLRERQQLRLRQGKLNWKQWLHTLPATRQTKLTAFAARATVHPWIYSVFSPRVRDRAAAVDKLAIQPGKSKQFLLDTLLIDPSRYVRLHVMNVFWQHQSDAMGTQELFWLAVEARSNQRYVFKTVSRIWRPVPVGKVPEVKVRFESNRVAVPAFTGHQRAFCASDGSRAAHLLIHWHPPELNSLLMRALQLDCLQPVLPGEGFAGMSIGNESNFLLLLRQCPPKTAKGYLLEQIDRSTNFAQSWMHPQGRYYFVSSRTKPLSLLIIAAGMNPADFGIVTSPVRWENKPVQCCFAPAGEAAAIKKMQRWCRHHGIAPDQSRNFVNSHQLIDRMFNGAAPMHQSEKYDLQSGLIRWLFWAAALPADQRRAMLAWGEQSGNIEQAALAFAPSSSSQMDAARILSTYQDISARRILLHLLNSPVPEIAVTALNAVLAIRPDSQLRAVLGKITAATGPTPPPPMLPDKPWTRTMIFRGHRVVFYKHRWVTRQNRAWVAEPPFREALRQYRSGR
jgi:hypothetical protein